ncbi:hypothetical protein QMK19_18075 [Streptomyces sp. H10-C2]|uniref:hypothetical protein n=1 Tax=unclassified Streptomyces TaxID=2593676 RepID=UPI0024BAF979|nr:MULTISPECIES: hypothetical protein [unclassified Streptomyces]MDJ0343460.1 hypothetical protein [Streptomyces sp. PH10-H1]MDJ0371540.1 hypothetical protein [Streptomyces sp. H10-C2]
MTSLSFLELPIDPAEGFPQAFRLALGEHTYQFRLYANVAEEIIDGAPGGVLDLPTAGAFLVLSVDREGPAGLVTILRRKLVPGVEYPAAELVLTFRTMLLDLRNLNGIGSFGSEIVGGVSLR